MPTAITLDTLEVKATGDVSAAIKALDQLRAKLDQLSGASSKVNVSTNTSGLGSVSQAVKAYKDLVLSLQSLSKFNGQKAIFSESAIQQVHDMGTELIDLQNSAQRALYAMDALREAGTIVITPETVSSLNAAVEKLSGNIDKLANKKMVAKKAADNMSKSTKDLGENAKTASKSVGKLAQLWSSIKRIAMYRLIRSALKAVTEGFSEGVKNAYAWAQANDYAFTSVMDTYATEANYIKNTLGALASTVLTTLLPVFEVLADVFVRVINHVNDFVAAIKGTFTGDYSYMKAKEVAVQFGDATEDAAKSQKKLNQQLMKFDELNVILTKQASGSETSGEDPFELSYASDWSRNNWGWIAAGGIALLISQSIGSGVLSGLTGATAAGAVGSFATALRNALQIIAGVTLTIVGIIWAIESGKMLAQGNTKDGLIGAVGSAIAAGMGCSYIGQMFGPQGEAIGFLVGAAISLVATVVSAVIELANGKKVQATGDEPTPTPTQTKTGTFGGTGLGATSAIQRITGGLGFADGGFPTMGSLFLAGEVPGQTEMVGTINGRTGVASGDEITGISEAVYSTGNETAGLLRELIDVTAREGYMPKASAKLGHVVSDSLRMYKAVTG